MRTQEIKDKLKKSAGKAAKQDKNKEPTKTKKRDESSDSEDGTSSDDEEVEMDAHEYRKFLSQLFPSKHMSEKVKAGDRAKDAFKKLKANGKGKGKKEEEEEEEDEEEEDEEEEEEEETKKKRKTKGGSKKTTKKATEEKSKKVAKSKKSKKIVESDSEEDDDDDDDDDFKGKSSKFNIIFTIGGAEGDEYDDDDEEWEEYDEDSDEDDDTEDEDEEVSSSDDDDEEDDDEEEAEWEDVEEDEDEDEDEGEEDDEEEEDEENVVLTRSKAGSGSGSGSGKKSPRSKKAAASKSETETDTDINTTMSKNTSSDDFMKQLKELYKKNKDNADAKECVKACEETIKKHEKKVKRKEKKHQEKNGRIFKKLVKDKNTNNDFEFFGKLEVEGQKKIIKELRDINKLIRIEKPYRLTLLEADMPAVFKGAAMKKVNSLRYMEPGSGEYYKIKNWVDTFMRIPFGKYNQLPLTIENGVDQCHEFMETAKNTLDNAVYGLDDAKMQIMQMMGQLITNPDSIGTAIAIQGPMGTGKTTLVKEGISKILNRPFAFIALGGATDSSFLEGHSYTYEGSTWGKIVQILVDSKCMNPVIYFDELDKISDTPKGEEIAGILTHLTDTSQNSQFHDKYFAEIDFDLSKCLFIFSYNDESKINPILRDRMYRIHTKGYETKQKTIIANDYLLPTIREQVKFKSEDIIIPDETLQYIMEEYCNKEAGVRNMKRCLEIIYTKLNLYRLMKPDTNLFQESMTLKVSFPFQVTIDVVKKLIKKDGEENQSFRAMYV